MVEVGLVLPIFLIAMVAIIEFGWYTAIAAATSSASREGARYGATVGDDPVAHYVHCDGIRAAARSTTDPLITLADGDITIRYIDGPMGDGSDPATCGSSPPDSGQLERWDRVEVEVSVTYDPIVPILDGLIGTHELVSIDRRSIVKSASP
jgi:Flp pilus assembly protein TadG